jgi:branched-chain amino acid aminotransferase
MNIEYELLPEEQRRKLPEDESTLGFGKLFTDHMFSMKYSEDKGWYEPKIHPYGPIALDPAAVVLHYGQEAFEGLKAYRLPGDGICLFRPDKNVDRMNASAERLVMPQLDKDDVLDAIKQLVTVEKDWVPHSPMTSLYIRPTFIGTQAELGVHASTDYLFFIILSPVGAYYETGFSPVKILVEETYTRAAPGGTGFAKVGGNYASSMLAAKLAHEKGYTQVLWLDGVERKYIEEVGTMNFMVKFGDTIITSPLTGSILPGVTRDSVLQILKDWGDPVEERLYTIDEVIEAYQSGDLKEAFGTGTAAVITPVSELCYKGSCMTVGDGEVGPTTQRLYDELVAIQYGTKDDPYGWRVPVC